MTVSLWLTAVLLSTSPAPDASKAIAGPAAPAVQAPAAAPSGQAALDQALEILHEQDNTVALLQQSVAKFDEALKLGLPAKLAAKAHAFKAMAYLRLGDLEKDPEQKLKVYEKGRAVAEEGIAADPKSADAWFYKGANMGRWGQTKGVLNALFMLGDLRKTFNTALELEPNHADARLALGKVDEEVPGLMGGSKERAEAAYKKSLEMDPRFTRAMLDLGELLKKDGRKEEARAWIKKALEEKNPSKKGEFRKFDRARAERLLAGL